MLWVQPVMFWSRVCFYRCSERQICLRRKEQVFETDTIWDRINSAKTFLLFFRNLCTGALMMNPFSMQYKQYTYIFHIWFEEWCELRWCEVFMDQRNKKISGQRWEDYKLFSFPVCCLAAQVVERLFASFVLLFNKWERAWAYVHRFPNAEQL